jgi:hypothetical protein
MHDIITYVRVHSRTWHRSSSSYLNSGSYEIPLADQVRYRYCQQRNPWNHAIKFWKSFLYIPNVLRDKLKLTVARSANKLTSNISEVLLTLWCYLALCHALCSSFMCLWAIYIFPESVHIFPPAEKAGPSWEYIIRSQTHECGNWGWVPGIPFLGIFVSNFRHFVFAVCHVEVSNGRIFNCLARPGYDPGQATRLFSECTRVKFRHIEWDEERSSIAAMGPVSRVTNSRCIA